MALAAAFARWRNRTRACFGVGVVLCGLGAARPESPGDPWRLVLLGAGVAAIALTFWLYFRLCNRCPRCGESFSRAREYASSETSGLPLFQRIARCPFCSLPLRPDASSMPRPPV
jgi:hypothetical protein